MISLKTVLAAGLLALAAGAAHADAGHAGAPLQGAAHDGDDAQINLRYRIAAESSRLFGPRAASKTTRTTVQDGRSSAEPRTNGRSAAFPGPLDR